MESDSLSSPPHSPDNPNSSQDAGTHASSSTIRVLGSGGGGGGGGGVPTSHQNNAPATTTAKNNTTSTATNTQPQRKKPGPKPKPKDPNAPEPEKKTRKPRQPRDASAPVQRRKRGSAKVAAEPTQTTAASGGGQTATAAATITATAPVQHQPKLTELVSVMQPDKYASSSSSSAPQPARTGSSSNNAEAVASNPTLSHINVAPSTPRPASSGQVYDPIRSAFEPSSKPPSAPGVPGVPPASPPLNRASASPSITSLIDPPPTGANSAHLQAAVRLHQQTTSVTSAPASPAATGPVPVPALTHSSEQQQAGRRTSGLGAAPMELDNDADMAAKPSVAATKKSDSASAGTVSAAPTPPVKPARQKEAPPPLPTGSGLLSGTPFGPTTTSNGPTEQYGTNIWLTFPLKGQNNITINYAQEVEKKYGFAALHPRIAARQERQRQITAAGAALEKAQGLRSADDMSVDLSEPDSNMEMGGMDEEGSGGATGVKRRRKRKAEDYDKDDGFVDDTELVWEQQALMAKDGFFVYFGPLLAENDKPTVERADGTVRRGRGRGRGGSARGDGTSTRGRGGGRGSRGGTTVRKPRVTKADRAMMEQEKHEREKMAANLAAKQPVSSTYPAGAM